MDSKYYYLVLELFTGIDLVARKTQRAPMTEPLIAQIMYKVLKGVAALHLEGICHRDLKLDNILIDEEDNKIKIIDFGMAE